MPRVTTLRATPTGALTLHSFDEATALGATVIVTDRFGGHSHDAYCALNLATHVGDNLDTVTRNRSLVTQALAQPVAFVQQVHGTTVVEVDNLSEGTQADAIVSRGQAVGVLVADCVPIALVDTASPRHAVVHAGWRGLADGVIAAAMSHFATPATVHAFVGPSISKEAYQVGPEVSSLFAHVDGALAPDGGDRSRLDLRTVTAAQLAATGIRDHHIVMSAEVTDGGSTFYSDRAARPCGRFALIALRSS